MSAFDDARLWWQRTTGEDETPIDGDAPAWAASMVVHVGVLLALTLFVVPPDEPRPPPITILQTTAEPDEPFDEEPPSPVDVVVGPVSDAGALSTDGSEAADATASLLAEEPVVSVETVEFDDVDDHIPTPDDALKFAGLKLDDRLTTGKDVAVGTTGASGAVDRLTAEIVKSLEQRPTLVVWVFDRSVSLAGQRDEIAQRLDRVFAELTTLGSAVDGSDLLNMVFAYGDLVMPVVRTPTREGADVVKAIRSIPVDESGVENTFTALAVAAKAANGVRMGPPERNVMIVVFTDEVGNDQHLADQVSTFCRSRAMRIYVVGVPAPFGRKQVEVRFVEFDRDKYASDDQFPVVDQGPETLHPEVVQISSGGIADEPMDSGFGPYSLSKLCAETGGIYFCVHANRNAGGRVMETAPMASRLRYFFEGDVMRAYRPDYQLAVKVDRLIAANRAKQALVTAANYSVKNSLAEPQMTFPREDDAKLVTLLSEAQKAAAALAPKIDALHTTLQAGQADRDKLGASEKRWQAGYDLAMGRVVAAKVRTDAYNTILGQAKSGMKFANPENDTWRLVRSDTVANAGSAMEKLAKQARFYLERVVKDHPGTPWALIAAEELQTPLGYEWREAYTGVNARRDNEAGGNGRRRDDAQRNLAPPKPPRPLQNL